jgi:hypothetical protein
MAFHSTASYGVSKGINDFPNKYPVPGRVRSQQF